MNSIAEGIIEVLEHWKEARETRLSEIEIEENLRCAVDLAALLAEHGLDARPDLWKVPGRVRGQGRVEQ